MNTELIKLAYKLGYESGLEKQAQAWVYNPARYQQYKQEQAAVRVNPTAYRQQGMEQFRNGGTFGQRMSGLNRAATGAAHEFAQHPIQSTGKLLNKGYQSIKNYLSRGGAPNPTPLITGASRAMDYVGQGVRSATEAAANAGAGFIARSARPEFGQQQAPGSFGSRWHQAARDTFAQMSTPDNHHRAAPGATGQLF